MAALTRLSQRIRENFHESTRDLSLLTSGAASSAAYLDAGAGADDRATIGRLLESRAERERLEGMKRVIAGMSKGRDMEPYFAGVVKNVVAGSVEIKKLVYIYLLRFAATNSDLVLLSINTFQKDLGDPSPLIRSMSLRMLTSIRVPVIQGIVMLGLKKLVADRNPWVRKTVAGGLAKVYEMDPTALPQLLPLLQTLLASPSPLTLGATLTAFSEMCPDRLDVLHPYYRHICRLLVDADEWGQAVALAVLTRYARAMLEKPDDATGASATKANGADHVDGAAPAAANLNGRAANEDVDDEYADLDPDLAMFLHHARPLFQSRNPAVVLAAAQAYFYLAPEAHRAVGKETLVPPLLRLAGQSAGAVGEIAWGVVGGMVDEKPALFKTYYTRFYVHAQDAAAVKRVKIKALEALVTPDNAEAVMRELKQYTRLQDNVCEDAVRAIGHCVRTQPSVAEAGLRALIRLLKSKRDMLVAQAVIVLKSVILARSTTEPKKLVTRLARCLDGITHPHARASVFWLVGQYAASEDKGTAGLGWEGLELWVPDVLRKGVKGFAGEAPVAKLQILTLATKLLALTPEPQLDLTSQYLFFLARYDADYDVRDRARFLHALLRGVLHDKEAAAADAGREADEAEEVDVGGVVLRREQVKVVLLGQREAVSEALSRDTEYDVGTLSRLLHHRLGGYTPLPEWTDDPTDATLRDSEIERPPAPPLVVIAPKPTYVAAPSPIPVHVATPATRSAAATPPPGSSASSFTPAASVPRAKFRDLDDFLNSDSESDDSDDDDGPHAAAAAAAPGQTQAQRQATRTEYTEYDEDVDDESENEEETDDELDEEAPLQRMR
ncbi:AP-3 complex subunit beta [Cryptotrichosporon argae]